MKNLTSPASKISKSRNKFCPMDDILQKIDAYIEFCKTEIQKRKSSDGKARTDAARGKDSSPDKLQDYVGSSKRFGFAACVRDCFGEKSVESYKAIRKRIDGAGKDVKRAKPSSEDFNKLEQLYTEMRKIYSSADSLYENPGLPPNSTLLPKALRNHMKEVSEKFDEQIFKKESP